MTTQTDNFSARQRIISVVLDSNKEATNYCNLKLQIPELTLMQKLHAFDPTVHGGELVLNLEREHEYCQTVNVPTKRKSTP